MSVISSKRIYKNFGECIFLDNGIITLGVTLEEGPRIIYFSLAGKEKMCFLKILNAYLLSLQENTEHGWHTADTGFGVRPR